MAVARYVQDTPLIDPDRKEKSTSLPEVIRLLQALVSKTQQGAEVAHDAALVDFRREVQEIRDSVGPTNTPALEDLLEQVKSVPPTKQERLFVRNLDSGVVHEILVDKHQDLPDEACRTVCGWKWVLGRPSAVMTARDVGLARKCLSCVTRNDEASSDASQDDAAEDRDEAECSFFV